MGIELIIFTAHIFSSYAINDVIYEQRPTVEVRVQQQIHLQQQDMNTQMILEAIESVK